MPSISPEEEKRYLAQYISSLVETFGRDANFTISDLYTIGGTSRRSIGDEVFLPRAHAQAHLEDLAAKGLVRLLSSSDGEFTFQVEKSYEGLPDRVTPQDIYREKQQIISRRLSSFAPNADQKLSQAEKRLLTLRTDADISEIGNLCVQCLEDFAGAVWDRLFAERPRPARKQIKDLLSPIFKEVITTKSAQSLADSLWTLFDSTRDLAEKLKHRAAPGMLDDHHAKLVVMLTALICEEVLYYMPD